MNRKRSGPPGSFRSPVVGEADSPAHKRFALPSSPLSSLSANQKSRFVAPTKFAQNVRNVAVEPLKTWKAAACVSPVTSSRVEPAPITPTRTQPPVFRSPQPFKAPLAPVQPQQGPPDMAVLDFQTASQAPIRVASSKLNAAQALLRDVEPSRLGQPDSLDQELDVDWDELDRVIRNVQRDPLCS